MKQNLNLISRGLDPKIAMKEMNFLQINHDLELISLYLKYNAGNINKKTLLEISAKRV